MVSIQPLCVFACIKICAHVKDPEHWQTYLWMHENTACIVGRGSAALAASIAVVGKVT